MNSAALVAHQGGWDEILMVAGPLAIFALVLWLANKRANAKLAELEAEQLDDAEELN
jgi:cyanate permease